MFKHARMAMATVLVVSASSAAFAQGDRPKGIPNSQKYRNAGVKPATGRSGSASLEARVLISKQGSMTVEASTGSVAAGSGPGVITKAQIKFGGVTRNHTGLNAGGYFTTTVPAAPRGTPIQIQANVRGIDPHRTGVVTVSTPAALRPDIAVRAVNGPAQHAPGAPVTFVATVDEKNGDAGARADCTLAVNGIVVGIASAIWIDAGGTVSCRFSHAFPSAGTYSVSASAANVEPGDWDTSNNSASATITIADPGNQIASGSLELEQRNSTARYLERRAGEYVLDRAETRNYTTVMFQGAMAAGAAPVRTVNVNIFANGSLQHHASLAPRWWTTIDFPNFRGVCGHYNDEYFDGTYWVYSRDYFTACTYIVGGGAAPTHSQFIYQQLAGEVVYAGSDTFCGPEPGCNTYNWIDRQSYGGVGDLRWTAGTAVRVKVDFIDTDGVSAFLDRTLTLVDESAQVNRDSSGVWYDEEYGDVYWEQRLWGVLFRAGIVW